MYWYNKGFYTEKVNENAYEMSDEEYSTLMENIGNGAILKEVNGKPVAEITQKVEENILNNLRLKRENECFPVINRGELWYQTLTESQKTELKKWYNDWLNVTDTKIVPQKPQWLK